MKTANEGKKQEERVSTHQVHLFSTAVCSLRLGNGRERHGDARRTSSYASLSYASRRRRSRNRVVCSIGTLGEGGAGEGGCGTCHASRVTRGATAATPPSWSSLVAMPSMSKLPVQSLRQTILKTSQQLLDMAVRSEVGGSLSRRDGAREVFKPKPRSIHTVLSATGASWILRRNAAESEGAPERPQKKTRVAEHCRRGIGEGRSGARRFGIGRGV